MANVFLTRDLATGKNYTSDGENAFRAPLGTQFNQEDVPAAVYMATKKSFVVTADNKYIDFNEGSDRVAILTEGTYRFDNSFERDKFSAMVENAMDTATGVSGDYTVSFSASTYKFTISQASPFTLKFGTGTNASSSAAAILGFNAADTGSSTSHTSDNTVSPENKAFLLKTDACYPGRSSAFIGFVDTAGAQYAERTVRRETSVSGISAVSGFTEGDELFTLSGCIIVESGVNDAIDFKEDGGSELNATVAAGEYVWPYSDLEAAIKTACEAVGAKTFTVSFDHDEDKFSIAVDSGTVQFLFATGTNQATSIDTTIGFDHSDTSAAISHTASNRIALMGKIGTALDSRVKKQSVGVGFLLPGGQVVYTKRFNDGTKYLEVLNTAGEWLPSPVSESFTGHVLVADQDEAPNGAAVRILVESSSAAPNTYRVQYRTSAGGNWQTSATTIGSGSSNLAQQYSVISGGNTEFRPQIKIAENGLDVVMVYYYLGANHQVFAQYSTDGGATWTQSTGPATDGALYASGATGANPLAIAIRENKCGIILAGVGGSDTRLLISDDSGSGFTTFASTSFPAGTHFNSQNVACLEIQYFPGEAGVNRYRFVAAGYDSASGNQVQIVYFKGDGTGSGSLTPWTAAQYQLIHTMARDQVGNGNRIVIFVGDPDDATFTGIVPGYTNTDYNGGTLTVSASTTDMTGGLVMVSDRSNNATDNIAQSTFAQNKRAVVVNDKAYVIAMLGSAAGDTTPDVILYKSDDVTTNTYSLVATVSAGAANTSPTIAWISGMNALVMAWKELTTTSNHASEGQIWAKVIEISGTTLTLFPSEQVDGSQAVAGYQGFPMVTAGPDSATVQFLRDDTNDTLYWNKFV